MQNKENFQPVNNEVNTIIDPVGLKKVVQPACNCALWDSHANGGEGKLWVTDALIVVYG